MFSLSLFFLRELFLYSCRYYVKCSLVSAAVDDDICVFFGRFYVNTVHDFNGIYVLIDNTVNISATLGYVATETAQNSFISIGIRKDLDVKKFAKSLVVKGKDAVNDNDRCGTHACDLVLTGMNTKIIIGYIRTLAHQQLA